MRWTVKLELARDDGITTVQLTTINCHIADLHPGGGRANDGETLTAITHVRVPAHLRQGWRTSRIPPRDPLHSKRNGWFFQTTQGAWQFPSKSIDCTCAGWPPQDPVSQQC